jgi:hypothetical protein
MLGVRLSRRRSLLRRSDGEICEVFGIQFGYIGLVPLATGHGR